MKLSLSLEIGIKNPSHSVTKANTPVSLPHLQLTSYCFLFFRLVKPNSVGNRRSHITKIPTIFTSLLKLAQKPQKNAKHIQMGDTPKFLKNAFASFEIIKIFLISELTHQIWMVFRFSRPIVKLMSKES